MPERRRVDEEKDLWEQAEMREGEGENVYR